jgi:beta-lactam-binding protein with PASTA domain
MDRKYLKELLFLIPLCSFFLGYFFISFCVHEDVVIVPLVIGKSSQESVELLSQKGLNMRILRKQEDSDLPEGVVLEQLPHSGETIRPNRHVFVTVSHKPPVDIARCMIGTRYSLQLSSKGLFGDKERFFKVPSVVPREVCVAQFPSAGQPIGKKGLTVYVSKGAPSLAILPSYIGQPLEEAEEALQENQIKVKTFLHGGNRKDGVVYRVVDQKPMAGSIVDLNRPLYVQLQVSLSS